MCLTGDTLVDTIEGAIPIKDLLGKTGKVFCYDEKRQKTAVSNFSNVVRTGVNVDVYEIELENGTKIKATADHPFLTQRGWVPLQELTDDDEIIQADLDKYRYFNGVRYTRDEKTGYYLSASTFNNRRKRLHRAVWEFYNGAIPKGLEVHHIDHDKQNNVIENLELLSKTDHAKRHGKELTSEQRQKLRNNIIYNISPKAKAWHSSPEGIAWHREHAKHSILKYREVPTDEK